LVFGPDGNLYVSSTANHEILRYKGRTGEFIDIFVAPGSGGLTFPNGLAFGPDGNLYVVIGGGPGGVLRYDGTTGAFIDAFVPIGSGGIVAGGGLLFRCSP
jgi:sugar lactone lactonase YvrE